MNSRLAEVGLVAGAIAYLAAFGWSVLNLTYDMWGAFVVIPPLAVLGVVGLRRMFPGELAPIGTIMAVGLFVKFGGAAARYWVGFEAYGGGIDAQRYHDYAVERATAVWSGEAGVLSLVPEGVGTPFMEDATALIYALTGASKLGAFFVFAWLAYWGTAWFVKAACIALPGLVQQRYAVLMVLAPSVVYWPSSIGKEAWMLFTLGFASYGFARVLAGRGLVVPIVMSLVGLLAAAMVRPHMAGLWVAGALPALVVALFVSRPGAEGRITIRHRAALLPVFALAIAGLAVAAGATLRYLDFADETGDVSAISIIEETTRRTQQAGSNFEPPSVSSPLEWPFAFVRTITRPLLSEASGAGPMLSALEMTVLIGVAVIAWRRLANVPLLVMRVPYATFAMTVLFFGTLAFTSFANLGVLTRQRTLLFPFLLLMVCVPTRREDRARLAAVASAAEDAAIAEARRSLEAAGPAGVAVPPVAVPEEWHGERRGSTTDITGGGRAGSPRSVWDVDVSSGRPAAGRARTDDVWRQA